MQARFIVLASIFAVVISSMAQFSVGITGFPQISSNSSDNIRSSSVLRNRITFSGGAGLLLGYDFSDRIGIRTGCIYSSQNQIIRSTYTLYGTPYEHVGKKRFDYLKFPVLVKFSHPIAKKIRFNYFLGPQLSYLLKYDGGMVVYIPDVFFDLPVTPSGNDYYKKLVLDATGGLGFDISISKRSEINTGFKLDYAITDTENKNATYEGFDLQEINGQGDRAARNITGALMIGFTIKILGRENILAPSNKFRGKSYGKKRRF
ncbi:MAG: PorT family protein [Cytophagaceae bacterium]|jgi:hypothetical protein|nr:PorT family protein [Cytophagaceae bacterium]